MNCKPPCMAIIIRADYPEMIGLPVEVNPVSVVWENQFCWEVLASKPVPCFDDETGNDHLSDTFMVPDEDLRPITGLLVDDEQLDEVSA